MTRNVWLMGIFLLSSHISIAQLTPYFPAFKRQSNIYPHAFQGGANNPLHTLADLDKDGKKELIILDRAGDALSVYRYHIASKTFSLAPELYQIFPDSLSKWLILKDLDHDGAPDLFTNSVVPGIPGISVYKGNYQNGMIEFTKFLPGQGRLEVLSYQNNNGNWINVYVSPEDLPTIEDMDRDGDLDVLSFEPGGSSIYYYENQASSNELFHFRLVDACWGKVTESGLSSMLFLSQSPDICASSGINEPVVLRHAGSSLLALTLDDDQDMDLLVGDIGNATITALYNGGNLNKAFITKQTINFPSESVPVNLSIFPFPGQGDFDYDGLEDLIFSPGDVFNSENVQVSWFYKNTGTPSKPLYTLQTKQFINEIFDGGSEACPAFFDHNADGMVDLLVSTKGYYPAEISGDPRFILLENRGNKTEPIFEVVDDNYLNINRFKNETAMLSPSAVDYDADGDTDLLCGEFFGSLVFFENTAGPGRPCVFALPVFQFLGIDVGSNSMPAMVDINGDDLPDLLIGERNGNINYFQNTGTRHQPQFNTDPAIAPNIEKFGNIDTRLPGFVTGYSTPSIITGGNKIRLVSGSVHGGLYAYDINNGQVIAQPQLIATRKNGSNTFVDFADLDNNGMLDMVVGNRRGGINFYHTTIPTSETTSLPSRKAISLQFSPNPFNESLFIRTTEQTQGTIHVFNVQGILVHKEDKFLGSRTIPTGNWAPGIYILQHNIGRDQQVIRLLKRN